MLCSIRATDFIFACLVCKSSYQLAVFCFLLKELEKSSITTTQKQTGSMAPRSAQFKAHSRQHQSNRRSLIILNNHFYCMIQTRKGVQIAPWQQKPEEDLQALQMGINTNNKSSNLLDKSIAVITPNTNELVRLVSIERPRMPRMFSNRERNEQPRERMRMKPVQLASLMGIGKAMVGEIAMQKKQIQSKMMQYLLLVYIGEELRQESAVEKIGEMRENLQCLFPLIGRKSKSKYGLNDFANQQL